jgi:hypothetical protein
LEDAPLQAGELSPLSGAQRQGAGEEAEHASPVKAPEQQRSRLREATGHATDDHLFGAAGLTLIQPTAPGR